MKLHGVFELFNVAFVFRLWLFATERNSDLRFKPGTREKSQNQVTGADFIKQARLSVIGFVNLGKQIHHMIRLAEIVQDVVVLSMNAKLFKRFFEGPGLLKKAEDFVDLNWKSPQISNSNCPSI